MPIYEYVCLDCGERMELMRSMKDADAPLKCDRCAGEHTSRMLSLFYASSGGRAVAGSSGGSCSGCAGGSFRELRSLMDDYELLLAVYRDDKLASQALAGLKSWKKEQPSAIFNAAVLQRDPAGHASYREDKDIGPGAGTAFGALVGGLVGLLGGPAGVIVGAAAGAATGGLVAGKADLGFEDKFLKEIQAALKPGTSALLLLVERQHAEAAALQLSGEDGKLLRHVVRREVIARLRSSLEE